jgi:hypothetical protein
LLNYLFNSILRTKSLALSLVPDMLLPPRAQRHCSLALVQVRHRHKVIREQSDRFSASSAAVCYLVQGGAKFAGYEYWKKVSVQFAGDQETAVKYRTAIYLGSASVAE